MERKINEVFDFEGIKLQCVASMGCEGCYHPGPCSGRKCSAHRRSDNTSVIFKKIENMEEKEIKISIPEGYEIDNEKSSFEKIVFKKKELDDVATWDDLVDKQTTAPLGSRYITTDCTISKLSIYHIIKNTDKNVAINERVAKSMLAMAQISQLMPYYGGAVTDEEWKNNNDKYTIIRFENSLGSSRTRLYFDLLAFHTEKQRDEFLKNNEQLVKDYLMIE